VLFYARVADRRLLELLEFYSGDIDALRRIGFDVTIETRPWAGMRAQGDACFAWWWATAFPVVLAWRLRRKPVVVTGASDLLVSLDHRRFRHWLKHGLTWASVRLAGQNIAISDYEASSLASIGAPRVTRLYPGVDTEYYQPAGKTSEPSAVTVGQLNEMSMRRKGIDVAIACVAQVRRKFPSFQLFVVGPIREDGARYLDRLREAHDFSGVEICGEVDRDRKRDYLSSAWLYLQPSTHEGFGLAAAEAMACGTVPICSAVGSLPEVVGAAGVVLPDTSAAEVATAVVRLLLDDSRRLELQTAARATVDARFNQDRRAGAMADILSAIGLVSADTGVA
jgi:glycosyltransferase involved in cell wall biosynthesis